MLYFYNTLDFLINGNMCICMTLHMRRCKAFNYLFGGECSFTAAQVCGIFTCHFHISEHRWYSLQTSFRQIPATVKTVKDHQSALLSSQVSAGVVTPTGALGMTIPTMTCSLTCSCHQLENMNQVQTFIFPSLFCQFCPINLKFGAHLQSNRESDFITILNVPSPLICWC